MKLAVEGLNSHYGPAHILFDIALEVGDGEVVALLGRNGAGKSTTFRSIVGLVAQRTGRIVFEGKDVSDQPTLVLLDEPSEGLSPKIVEQMVDAILTMKKEGVSIVVSEQNLHFARLISDRAYIIERGRICFSGTMAELDARPDIRDAHLAL
jgi:ABC-type branched-subunit amino acid transport system ATPase component